MSVVYCAFYLLIVTCVASTIDPDCPGENCTERDLTGYAFATELIGLLKNLTYYDKNIAPGQAIGNVTNVYVGVYVEAMSSFKTATMDYEVDMYLATAWFDQRLRHESSDPILINSWERADLLWSPDLYFVNSKAAEFQVVTTPNFMVLVYNDGLVFRSVRVSVTLSCIMILTRFPLDEQTCPIFVQSYAYEQSTVNLTWFVKENAQYPIGYNPSIRLNDMEITGQGTDYCNFCYPMFRGQGCWSCLSAVIKMKRLVMFHVFQTYVPTAMLVCVSWLSFWLDPKSAPARVSLAITSLLTLVSVSNGARQGLPQVSYIKAIDIWLMTCTAFVFCTLLEYALVSFLLCWRVVDCACHSWQHAVFAMLTNYDNDGRLLKKPCVSCQANFEIWAKRVDRYCRSIFPLSFLAFCILYWLYYLWF